MNSKGKTGKQIAILGLIVAVFALFNLSIYFVLTRRLANNFSDTSQAKMIDVAAYLPHNPDSVLVRIDSSLKLTENLPVLISGGVSVCSLVQGAFAKEPDLWFAQKGLGGDNAVGAAILASMR